MSDYSLNGLKKLFRIKGEVLKSNKKYSIIAVSFCLVFLGLIIRLWNIQPTYYAHAYSAVGIENKAQIKLLASGSAKDILLKNNGLDTELLKEGVGKNKVNEIAVNQNFEQQLYAMVGETPIKDMVPDIAQRDQRVAALLIGIAKKESSFGQHVPKLDGKDCFNYWGYKGSGKRGTGMGYACFESTGEAIRTVGDRIENLVKKDLDTPAKMVVWKCGSSCVAHDPAAVKKWISDVEHYFYEIVQS